MSRLTAVTVGCSLHRAREARLRSRRQYEKNTCTIDARIPPYMGSVSATMYVPLAGKYLTRRGVTCCWDTTTSQWLCSSAALNIRVKCGSESEPARPPKLGIWGLKFCCPSWFSAFVLNNVLFCHDILRTVHTYRHTLTRMCVSGPPGIVNVHGRCHHKAWAPLHKPFQVMSLLSPGGFVMLGSAYAKLRPTPRATEHSLLRARGFLIPIAPPRFRVTNHEDHLRWDPTPRQD